MFKSEDFAGINSESGFDLIFYLDTGVQNELHAALAAWGFRYSHQSWLLWRRTLVLRPEMANFHLCYKFRL